MPRPKRKNAATSWTSRGISIGDKAAGELEAIIGQPVAGPLRLHIERLVDVAISGSKHLDAAPRHSDYVLEFGELRNLALNLCNKINDWSGYYNEELEANGVDVLSLEMSLCKIIETAEKIRRDHTGRSSMGPPQSAALKSAVLGLSKLFRKNYKGPKLGIVRHEEAFIKKALVAGRAIPASYTGIRMVLTRARKGT